MKTRRIWTLVTILIATATAGGCTSGTSSSAGDKAGGARAPVLFRLASVDWSGHFNAPLLRHFAARVAKLSGNRLQVRVTFNVGFPSADHEQQIVREVRAGRYDLGWIATRGWDELGVKTFQALQAPFLITDYTVMDAIARSPLARRMLGGLREAGVAGLALVPDTLRYPTGRHHPLVSLREFAGARIQVERSRATDSLIKALGATPVHAPASSRNDGELDPFVAITTMTAVTGNVVLYARMSTLFANRAALTRLDPKLRAALRTAARELVELAQRRIPSEQAAATRLCRDSGVPIAIASRSELAALRRATQPVTRQLERDPKTKVLIDEIAALKAKLSPAPALRIPPRCRTVQAVGVGAAKLQSPSILNGAYRWVLTKAAARAYGVSAEDASVATVDLLDGKWVLNGDPEYSGTYRIRGDRLALKSPHFGYTNTFTFRRDKDGTLHLKPVLPMDRGDQYVMSSAPWRRVGPPVRRSP
jgi:TRAP-type C4-dicarboxylate transport system substrate-binding protein